MKIAYLSASIIPSRDANSIHVMKMCQAFVKNGHEVTLFARKSKDRVKNIYEYYGVNRSFRIETHSWPNIRGLGGLIYAKSVKKSLKKLGKFDIYYGRDLYSLLEVLDFDKSKIFYESHKPPSNNIRKKLESMLFSTNNFNRLVVISNALKEKYLEIFPFLTNEQVVVAHDGSDPPNELVNYNKIDIKTNNRIKIGYIGHLYPGKGMEVIIKLAKRLPQFDFYVIGGQKEDIDYWTKQNKMKNLIFKGFIPHGILFKYYSDFDIMLAPYQYTVTTSTKGGSDISKWMSPLKIFEYMANGKAIISSDLPVLKEVLVHGKNSLLCPPDDIESWERTVLKLANDEILRDKLGFNARRDFLENYTWEQRGKNVLA